MSDCGHWRKYFLLLSFFYFAALDQEVAFSHIYLKSVTQVKWRVTTPAAQLELRQKDISLRARQRPHRKVRPYSRKNRGKFIPSLTDVFFFTSVSPAYRS